jgi:N-acetylmuramoyl-L-alanine amidase CwlA
MESYYLSNTTPEEKNLCISSHQDSSGKYNPAKVSSKLNSKYKECTQDAEGTHPVSDPQKNLK